MHKVSELLAGERYLLAPLLILMLVNLAAVGIFPGGYDASFSIDSLTLLGAMWLFGLVMRLGFPSVPGLYVFQAFALHVAIGLQGILATSAIAPLTGAYVDARLSAIDRSLSPWLSWPEMVNWLASFPTLFRSLNYVYASVPYQLAVLLGLLSVSGRVRAMQRLVAASGIAGCVGIAIFMFIPALGPYIFYQVAPEQVPELAVTLAFDFPIVLEGLKSGQIATLSADAMSGLICCPSFHAASATILAFLWWDNRRLRWPLVALNAGVCFAAMPIGGHYMTDILAGIALGIASMRIATRVLPDGQADADRAASLTSAPTAPPLAPPTPWPGTGLADYAPQTATNPA